MPGFTITRGLGGSPSSLIARGFVETVSSIIRGGRRFAEKAIAELEESLKISVMLVSANGKELVKPIINSVAKIFRDHDQHTVTIKPKRLVVREAEKIKVTAAFKKSEKI